MTTTTSPITFVTCLAKIYHDDKEPFLHKNVEWRLQHFREIVQHTDMKVCVYGCSQYAPLLESLAKEFPDQVRWMPMEYEKSPLYRLCMDPTSPATLPDRRHDAKDTVEYMTLMNCKIEFVHDAILQNPWKSEIFAWMDFSMSYLFHNKASSFEKVNHAIVAASTHKISPRFILFPGCWDRIPPNNASAITNNIHWRFCGTFFIGSLLSLETFYEKYLKEFPKFLLNQQKLVWEVNFWAWMEANTDCDITWYASDHNDRLLDFELPLHLLPSNDAV